MANLTSMIMGTMIAVIVGVGVAVPVISDVIKGPCNAPNETADCTYNESLEGTQALLAGFIPILIVASILYGVAQYF